MELYSQSRDSTFHPFSYLTKVLGLAALGLAGVTIGAFFTQKWRRLAAYLSLSPSLRLSSPAYQSVSQRSARHQCPSKVRRWSSHGRPHGDERRRSLNLIKLVTAVYSGRSHTRFAQEYETWPKACFVCKKIFFKRTIVLFYFLISFCSMNRK